MHRSFSNAVDKGWIRGTVDCNDEQVIFGVNRREGKERLGESNRVVPRIRDGMGKKYEAKKRSR